MTPFPVHAPADLVAVGGEGPRTCADLRLAAGAVAARLAGHPEPRVVLACDNRFHFGAGLLGAWAAGRQVVLPPSTQPATLAEWAGTGAALLLHDRQGAAGHDLREWIASPPRQQPALGLPGADQDAVLVATSGSTGPSRCHPKTLGQLLEEVAVHARIFSVGPGSRVLVTAPPHHIYGLLFGILLPLRSGAAFLRGTALHAEAVVQAILQHGATHVVSVPAHLRALTESGPLPEVVRVFSSGAPLPAETAGRLAAAGWPVTEIFGSSETGGVAWREAPGAPWRVFPGVRAEVGADGRLEVDGPFLHPGQARPFVTSDLARRAPGGFELMGRADGVVKTGGKRVTLGEIEDRARAMAGVSDAAALCQDVGGARGQEVWLAVAGTELTPEMVRTELARWLDPLAMPRRLRVVPALPRQESGKLPRAELLALFNRPAVTWNLAPERVERSTGEAGRNRAALQLQVPASLGWFDGHFPGHPVLAGVVQLHTVVLGQARSIWTDLGEPRRVRRLKFRQTILPGDRLQLVLELDRPSQRLDFELSTARGSCSSGSLIFDGPPGEAQP